MEKKATIRRMPSLTNCWIQWKITAGRLKNTRSTDKGLKSHLGTKNLKNPLKIHPRKLTWIPKMMVWKRQFPLKIAICGIYVRFLGCTYKSLLQVTYTLGCPPSQDSSHHQDDITFLGSGIPIYKPSFATGIPGGGTTQLILITLFLPPYTSHHHKGPLFFSNFPILITISPRNLSQPTNPVI